MSVLRLEVGDQVVHRDAERLVIGVVTTGTQHNGPSPWARVRWPGDPEHEVKLRFLRRYEPGKHGTEPEAQRLDKLPAVVAGG